ncbi:MAG: SH3 domain-containing protein, partial [Treponema sp.]|nr:SH3 domain-containing protein [Treponema sp.]
EWCYDYNNFHPEANINPAREDTALVDESHLEFGKYNGIQDRNRRGGCKSDRVYDERIEDISVTYRSHHYPWLRTYGTTGMRVARNAPDSTVFTAYVNDNRVRIRQSPGLNGKILTAFDTGTVLEIISEKKLSEKEEYPWYQVRTKTNVIGWMYGEFVRIRESGE